VLPVRTASVALELF